MGADAMIGSVVSDFAIFASRWRNPDTATATAIQRLRSFQAKIGAVLTRRPIQ
jgi:hypothetical protein